MNQPMLVGKWMQFKGAIMERVGKLLGKREIQETGEAQRVRGRIEAAAHKDLP